MSGRSPAGHRLLNRQPTAAVPVRPRARGRRLEQEVHLEFGRWHGLVAGQTRGCVVKGWLGTTAPQRYPIRKGREKSFSCWAGLVGVGPSAFWPFGKTLIRSVVISIAPNLSCLPLASCGLTDFRARLFGMGRIFAHQVELLAGVAYWVLAVTGIAFQPNGFFFFSGRWATAGEYHLIFRLVAEQQLSSALLPYFHHSPGINMAFLLAHLLHS